MLKGERGLPKLAKIFYGYNLLEIHIHTLNMWELMQIKFRSKMPSKSIGFCKRHFCGNPVFSIVLCMLQKAGLETEATKA